MQSLDRIVTHLQNSSARVCVCVCVCQNEKKVPDKWQARQVKIVSARKRKVQNWKRPIS